MNMTRLLTALATAGALAAPAVCAAQDLEPPEKTAVSGRLMVEEKKGAPAGTAYFVFQRRLLEIPQEGAAEALRTMAESAVAVDEEGSFTLKMSPGNYLLVYEPGAGLDPKTLAPGEQSFARQQKLSPDQVKERIARIQDNAQKGLPIQKGKIGEAYVVENRYVRPPITDFGEIPLADPDHVTVMVEDEEGKAADFPVALRLRGKSGDIYEPHPPTVSEKGKFTFHDLFPQSYQVFGLPTKPAPGQGDEATTPSVMNADFLFTGVPMKWTVKVNPRPPAVELTAPDASEATGEAAGKNAGEESAAPRKSAPKKK